jgi:hypothetical protein
MEERPRTADLCHEDALAQTPRLLLIGFLERQRTSRPASTVQKFPLPIDLHFRAPDAMIAKLALTRLK